MISGALDLLTLIAPPTDPQPTGPRTGISTEALLFFPTDPVAPPPNAQPCDTPTTSDSLQDLTSEKSYHLFGNRRFRNYKHFGQASKDARFVQGGKPCPTIGEFANIRKRNRGKALPLSNRYLDKVHLSIAMETPSASSASVTLSY